MGRRVFVTGADGQLGHAVMRELGRRGFSGVGSDVTQLDITDADAVGRVLIANRPDAVIHCAAWTSVDDAEDADNAEVVRAVNVDGTRNIASACSALDCKMVYISTEYVFGGQGKEPWRPDCREFCPLNVYGQTKLDGERAVSSALEKFFIVRTSWLFGTNGDNFVRTMLDIGRTRERICVVNDQIGTPTYACDLARFLVDLIETEKYGWYHVTNEGGYISWYDFACEIFRQAVELGHTEYAGENLSILAVPTEQYGAAKAVRPRNGRLDKSGLSENGWKPLPTWQDALHRFLIQEQVFGKE